MMNRFCDTLKSIQEELNNTETLPGIVLTVQRALVKADLHETIPAQRLVNTLLTSESKEEALEYILEYMSQTILRGLL